VVVNDVISIAEPALLFLVFELNARVLGTNLIVRTVGFSGYDQFRKADLRENCGEPGYQVFC